MRLLSSLVATGFLALTTASAQESAQVYLFQQEASTSPGPPIPRQLARQIILQRLSIDHESLGESLPASITQEDAISALNTLGKKLPSLFVETDSAERYPGEPGQLILMIEGVNSDDLAAFRSVLPKPRQIPSFSITDPPSHRANRDLLSIDLAKAGPKAKHGCGISSGFSPFAGSCWSGDTLVDSYDLQRTERSSLFNSMSTVLKLVEAGDIEAMVLLLPESSRWLPADSWSSNKLRARQAESVIIEDTGNAPQPASGGPAMHNWAATTATKGHIPACFQSFNSCVAATGNCTGHGNCKDKYLLRTPDSEKRRRDDKPAVCFACECEYTFNRLPDEKGEHVSRTHWGGTMCQKRDISVPFWLLAGFSVAIVGAVSFAVGMLFSVGEEKLPGVIGAGVSRNK